MEALFLALLLTVSNETMAWRGMRMPELFVKGRYLMAKDMNGNDSIVNLHGFGQTYSPYFNGYAWCKNPDGSVNWGKTMDAAACVKWNKEQISKMLDAGWKVNWMRLHMDPAWSNNEPKDLQNIKAPKHMFLSCGSKETPDRIKKAVDDLTAAGFKATGYVSEGTAHEFLTWRRSLKEMAPLLFK